MARASRRPLDWTGIVIYGLFVGIPLLVFELLFAGFAWIVAVRFGLNPLLIVASLNGLLLAAIVGLRISGVLRRRANFQGSVSKPRWIDAYDDLPGQRYAEHFDAMPPWTKAVPAEPPLCWVTLAQLRIVIYDRGPANPSLQVWPGQPDSWTLPAGSRLVLTGTFDPATYPGCVDEGDLATYYQYCADWESLTFEVAEGEHTGFAVTTCANPKGGRFPAAAHAAGALIAPVDHPLATDPALRAAHRQLLAAGG